MSTTASCRFTDSHEWFRAEGDLVAVGITQFAANELTDVTFVETKPVGTAVKVGDSVGEVESVKTTSDVYSAVAGTIEAVNEGVIADPSLVNSDPLGGGWLVKIRVSDLSTLAGLMDRATYDGRHPVH
ncbi:MAG: glycine cleavage system protein GcvH [Planctomycetota bacterium]|nr:glycine cleavage system protein GcvH [Planctomycetota bacterium]MDA1104978.1 glycine cleavage system protein GcvH [Planctomycetota bacterium]